MSTQATTVRSGRQGRRINPTRIFVYLVVGAYSLTTVLAFGWIFLTSLKTTPEFLSNSPWSLPEAPQFVNYVNSWKYANFGRYFANTLFAATVGGGVSVAISTTAAYALSRIRFPFSRVVGAYFLIGYMVPLMLSVIPIYFLLPKVGLGTGLTPLILIYIASGIPFNTFVLGSYLASLPYEMEEAAAIDGASPFRTFWQIMVPLAMPGLVSVFFINFLSLWNEFFLALLFLRDENMTLAVGLFGLLRRAQYSGTWAEVFAGMIISVAPVLIIFAFLQQRITKGLTFGAIKG
jgi:raffinose/stachyose/melibiose transport system permease protein/N-acetylglucosamine transport system permease protein